MGRYAGRVSVFEVTDSITAVLSLAMFAIQAWALVDAVGQRPDAYGAAGKWSKQAWLIILGLGVVAHLLIWHPLSLFNLVGIVAAIVYLVDVRPAIRQLTRN